MSDSRKNVGLNRIVGIQGIQLRMPSRTRSVFTVHHLRLLEMVLFYVFLLYGLVARFLVAFFLRMKIPASCVLSCLV